jgi:hypothetical protein
MREPSAQFAAEWQGYRNRHNAPLDKIARALPERQAEIGCGGSRACQ